VDREVYNTVGEKRDILMVKTEGGAVMLHERRIDFENHWIQGSPNKREWGQSYRMARAGTPHQSKGREKLVLGKGIEKKSI